MTRQHCDNCVMSYSPATANTRRHLSLSLIEHHTHEPIWHSYLPWIVAGKDCGNRWPDSGTPPKEMENATSWGSKQERRPAGAAGLHRTHTLSSWSGRK